MVHVAQKVVAKGAAVLEGVVHVAALLAVAQKEGEDAVPVELGNKRHQVQKRSRIDDRIGQRVKDIIRMSAAGRRCAYVI